MKTSCFSILLVAAVLLVPFGAYAQKSPENTIVGATAPGKGVLGESVQLQGKVKSIDKTERVVVVVGPRGNEVVFNLDADVRNFEQIRVGDLVTLTYAQAVAVELRKVQNTGIREREESTQTARSEPGQRPGGAIKKTVRMIADVVGINHHAQTITLRGAQHTVDLLIRDPAQLKDIKVGNQVEAVYIEAIALQVDAANK